MSRIELTEQELYRITKRTRPTAQARQLRALGIPFGMRTDKTVLVLRSAVDTTQVKRMIKSREPDFGALNERSKS